MKKKTNKQTNKKQQTRQKPNKQTRNKKEFIDSIDNRHSAVISSQNKIMLHPLGPFSLVPPIFK